MIDDFLQWVVILVHQEGLENKYFSPKEFMDKTEKKFSTNKSAKTWELFIDISSIQYRSWRLVEHIYLMKKIAPKLAQSATKVSENMLIEFARKSLSLRFYHLKLKK